MFTLNRRRISRDAALGFGDFGFWAAAIPASILVGLSKGGLPIVAMLSVPLMALVMNPLLAAGLLLPVYIASDMFGLWAYRRDFDPRLLRILVAPMLLGVCLGWATASLVSERLVAGLIGAIGTAFALNLLLRRPAEGPPRPPLRAPGWFWGTLAGFTSFVSHSGGPPYQVYVLPLRLKKTVFAGTTTILFAIVNAAKLVPYYFLGQLTGQSLHIALLLILPASLAVLAGVRLVRILPEKLFFQLVTWALLAISVKLIWDSALGP